MRKLTTEEFIIKSKAIHGDKYDYSKSIYSNSKQKLTITCPSHGDFEQTPGNHMHGFGCNRCAREVIESARRLTFGDFITRALSIHGDKYSYKNETYKNITSKMIITCSAHGDFRQSPKKHLIGHGCPVCGGTLRSTTDEFIQKSIAVHGDNYDYSGVNYSSAKDKVLISCRQHGDFWQTPGNHLSGKACPGCADYGFKRTRKTAYIYFLDSVSAGAVKIGVTHNKYERIKKLARDTPFQFDIIKIIKTNGITAASIESRFHNEFQRAGFYGFDGCTEWVTKTPKLMLEIEKLTPQ